MVNHDLELGTDNDEGSHAPDNKDSGSDVKKTPEVDFEAAKKLVLKEAVDPIADQVLKRITTDKDTIEMIAAWNKLSKQEQRDAMMLDDSMIMNGIKQSIPLYNFYQIWKNMSAATKRGLVYYGVLPFPEAEIRKIEDDLGFKDKAAGFVLKAAGFFLPQLKVISGAMTAYVASSEFNKQLARGVRARVAEKVLATEVANNTEHFEDEETAAAGIAKSE